MDHKSLGDCAKIVYINPLQVFHKYFTTITLFNYFTTYTMQPLIYWSRTIQSKIKIRTFQEKRVSPRSRAFRLRDGKEIGNTLLDTVKTNPVFTGKSGVVGGFDQVKTLVSSQEKTFQSENHQSIITFHLLP